MYLIIQYLNGMNTQNKGFDYQFIHAGFKFINCMYNILIHVYSLILGSVQIICWVIWCNGIPAAILYFAATTLLNCIIWLKSCFHLNLILDYPFIQYLCCTLFIRSVDLKLENVYVLWVKVIVAPTELWNTVYQGFFHMSQNLWKWGYYVAFLICISHFLKF